MRTMYGKRLRLPKKRGGFKTVVFFLFTVVIFSTIYIIYNIDKLLMPMVLASYDIELKNKVNTAINKSIELVVKETEVEAASFYIKEEDVSGRITSLTVNTLLVNDICSKIAEEISLMLGTMDADDVYVPVGSFLGIDALANIGPSVSISIKPMGSATVDYESSFESVGINQINFQVWLLVDTSIRVINPTQEGDVKMNRKVSLVNTVFSGQVPENYIGNNLLGK